jgi:hypothetical protein
MIERSYHGPGGNRCQPMTRPDARVRKRQDDAHGQEACGSNVGGDEQL